MSVRFVIGRAGTGKTRRCFDAIVEALRADPLGPPIYWILPKQATFMAERELTCASGLEGFCRARVISFETLGADVLANCGGDAVPQASLQPVEPEALWQIEKELPYRVEIRPSSAAPETTG